VRLSPTEGAKPERIAKVLARAGVASRREAERMIFEGRVSLDGAIVATPALTVRAGQIIAVDGKAIGPPRPTRLWLYHKPRGLITTTKDERGRPTVFENLPKDLPRVVSVGRLDFNSEGLLLLTNDGELARKLELPATGWVRRYRARVFGRPDPRRLAALAKGMSVAGIPYGPIEAKIESQKGDNAWLALALREGKKREIRNALAALGLRVSRLIRVSFGPFQLGKLKPGEIREVAPKVLAEQLGGLKTCHVAPDRRQA
jgi:23S rRNA pseudouridine2605 synthase